MGESPVNLESIRITPTKVHTMRENWKLWIAIVVFVLCIGPTFMSYQPYSFTWDDSDYLARSITVSKAFWSGDKHALTIAIPSSHPPVMTLLGAPWGSLASWDAAGKCFVSLAAITAFFVVCCLFFLLRLGLNPLYLIVAGMCVFAAIGPYPAGAEIHGFATGFMADSLFAWIAFSATLLIPYELKISASSTRDSVVRGILWAAILSAGVMTKVTFFYFLVLVAPILLFIRMKRCGLRSASLALASLSIFSVPAVAYWLLYGLPALKYAWASSFGHEASLYYSPLSQFLSKTIHNSPGMLLSGVAAIIGITYALFHRRDIEWKAFGLPLLVILGYCGIALASKNREGRFLITGFIGIPFLVGLLLSRKSRLLSHWSAIAASAVAFSCLVVASLPMMHRPDRESIHKSEQVIAHAIDSKAKRVLLATDSASLNGNLLLVAIAVSSRPSIESDTLAWKAVAGSPIEDDFQAIRESDLVVFQNKEALLKDPYTNQRAEEYEKYAQAQAGGVPVRVVDGIRIYGTHRGSK
jgi:hypothetical protein